MKSLSFVVFLFVLSSVKSMFWGVEWMWTKPSEENNEKKAIGDFPAAKVPFEAKTEDEKFLEAAKKYTDVQLTELDTCQHKVVLQIRNTCSQMTEEDLAKMSVNLLNCQSAIEGRKLFPCTRQMSLRECTTQMDPDTWNAYHLMSNRARAVCYAARQQQFRLLSEMTVNKLMDSAHSQLEAMEKLKEGQQQLESFASGTLQTVAEGQDSLLKQQENMRITQQSLRNFVGVNMRELTREKALIAAGHKQLSQLTEDIRSKLDSASSQLIAQSAEQQSQQQEVLKGLDDIKQQAKVIWDEIELSTQEILAQHEVAAVKYEETLNKLVKINETVNYLLQLLEQTHGELNERLGWLGSVIGATGLYTVLLHGLFLLLGMVATAFVHAPPSTRLCLLLIVPLNLALVYHGGYDASLDFASMTVIVTLTSAVHRGVMAIMLAHKRRAPSPPIHPDSNGEASTSSPSPTFTRPDSNLLFKLKKWWKSMQKDVAHPHEGRPASAASSHSSFSRVRSRAAQSAPVASQAVLRGEPEDEDDFSEPEVDVVGLRSSSPFRHASPSRLGSSPQMRARRALAGSFVSPPTPASSRSSRAGTPHALCQALCLNGTPCRRYATADSTMCASHRRV